MNKKIIKVIMFISIIVLFFMVIYETQKKFYSDDIYIFNLYQNKEKNESTQYEFNLNKNDKLNLNTRLNDSVIANTLANEKIAPGVKGEFNIFMSCKEAKSNISYQIRFNSKNNKPKNLLFNIKGKSEKHDSLEALEKDLKGSISKGESKIITIQWVWNYENGVYGDIQDTLDGRNISSYNFDINVLSGEIKK